MSEPHWTSQGSDEGSTLPRRRMDLPLASIVGGDTPRGGQQVTCLPDANPDHHLDRIGDSTPNRGTQQAT